MLQTLTLIKVDGFAAHATHALEGIQSIAPGMLAGIFRAQQYLNGYLAHAKGFILDLMSCVAWHVKHMLVRSSHSMQNAWVNRLRNHQLLQCNQEQQITFTVGMQPVMKALHHVASLTVSKSQSNAPATPSRCKHDSSYCVLVSNYMQLPSLRACMGNHGHAHRFKPFAPQGMT